jgi:hypothetical protein
MAVLSVPLREAEVERLFLGFSFQGGRSIARGFSVAIATGMRGNPSWRDQDSITLQFRERLTRGSIESIIRRVLKQGRFHREIQDRLAKATEAETVVFRIEAAGRFVATSRHIGTDLDFDE